MQEGPGPYCASWSCCKIKTDLEVFSVRFLQALREGNLKQDGEISEMTKSNHMVHMDLGPTAREHLKTCVPALWQNEILQELLKKPQNMIKDLRWSLFFLLHVKQPHGKLDWWRLGCDRGLDVGMAGIWRWQQLHHAAWAKVLNVIPAQRGCSNWLLSFGMI